jgi:hypothetical protein
MTENPDDTPYDPGGLPGVPEDGWYASKEALRRSLEAFHGFGEGSGPPPRRGPSGYVWIHDEVPSFQSQPENMHGDPPPLDLAADIRERLRIREEAPCVAAPLPSPPRREPSPECAECGHPKDGHRERSYDFKRGCWSCLECTGFVPKGDPA